MEARPPYRGGKLKGHPGELLGHLAGISWSRMIAGERSRDPIRVVPTAVKALAERRFSRPYCRRLGPSHQ